MYIQSYQIHNVLNVYRRQLSQANSIPEGKSGPRHPRSDAVSISEHGKNQSIMEKVTASVLKKITNVDPGSEFSREMIKQVQHTPHDPHSIQRDKSFIFNTIIGDNQKETRSIAVDTSRGLMNRLDELARAAVSRKTE